MNYRKIAALVRRELRTVARTPAYLGVSFAYASVVVALAWYSGGIESGYLAASAAMATAQELLVPVVAFALGARVVVSDRATGELEVFRTYDVTREEYLAAVYVGRFLVVAAVIAAPLAVVGIATWLHSEPVTTLRAWHGGVDSVLLLARFTVLTVAFGGCMLALALAVSTVSDNARTALALAVAALIAAALAADFAAFSGLVGGYVDESVVVWLTALTPNTAYRGLVLETVVGAAVGGTRATSPVASVFGIAAWTTLSLVLARTHLWNDR